MFSFFRSPKPVLFDFLEIDAHSHIIPNIDDGSRSPQESHEMIQRLQEVGFKKFIFTPHIYPDFYPNDLTSIQKAFDQLNQYIFPSNTSAEMTFAAEYFVDEKFGDLVKTNKLLVLGKKYILIEISLFSWPLNLENIIFQLLSNGFEPILAHPERYGYIEKHSTTMKKLRLLGCKFQINLLSLVDFYGKSATKLANEMINEKVASFICTDAHNLHQVSLIENLTTKTKLMKSLGKSNWLNQSLL